MSSEVSLSSVDFDDLDKYTGLPQATSSTPNFSEVILSRPMPSRSSIKNSVVLTNLIKSELRTLKVAQVALTTAAGGSVDVKIEAKWGDKKGPSVSVGASAQIYDEKGNYGKAEIKHDNKEGGSASISAVYTKKPK